MALYGSVTTPALGVLGAHSPDQAVRSIRVLASQYQRFSREPVRPAFEIIATMAVADPLADGGHSRQISVDALRPWIDIARRQGIAVILDLQPGEEDFLVQARRYESLLIEPHVSLALDPEWRLRPAQLPASAVGAVGADEVNSTAEWLADVTRAHDLPQKLLLVHQFAASMIEERDRLDASRPEISWIIQMDGFGTPSTKLRTWRKIRSGAPGGVRFGWKHFIAKDTPMLTPEQTMTVISPPPWYVSYQ